MKGIQTLTQEKLKQFISGNHFVYLLIGFSIALTLIWDFAQRSTTQDAPLLRLDTMIPHGFVLAPIEINNLSAIDSLLEDTAIVDLLTVPENNEKPKVLGKRVRLIRSPRNTAQYAVLVPEAQSQIVLNHSGKVQLVIKNKDDPGSQIQPPKALPRLVLY